MIRAVLTDIEGTTTSIAFVHRVLFPYASEHLRGWVAAHGDEPEVASLLDDARALAGTPAADTAAIAETLLAWIAADRKATPLKALQGLMWADGYRTGQFQSHIYDDAVEHLRAWHGRGLRLAVYSSGSVAAQKLLFAHTPAGDLTSLFDAWFDTTTGSKRDTGSYRAIARALDLPPGEILFLSDVLYELDPAREAGMATTWVLRDPDLRPTTSHPIARSFGDIDL